MEVVRGYAALDRPLRRPVVTIGNFDGVHLGHQRIIGRAVELARARKGTAVAYTFRPHPQLALRPDARIPLLLTYDEKLEILAKLGIDVTIEEPFGREFSTIAPEQFFKDILIHALNAEAIVVGYDFGFGRGRTGHLKLLAKYCKESGVALEIVEPQRFDGELASSSSIRQLLLRADIPAANRLLGREFFYRGVVVKGEGRGRKLGFPTANLRPAEKILLPHGVYATLARVGTQLYPSVTNIGVRPTFQSAPGELPALIETYILDQKIDLYGSTLEVRFARKLRDEKKFASVEDLTAQIRQDVVAARKLLASAPSVP